MKIRNTIAVMICIMLLASCFMTVKHLKFMRITPILVPAMGL